MTFLGPLRSLLPLVGQILGGIIIWGRIPFVVLRICRLNVFENEVVIGGELQLVTYLIELLVVRILD